MPSIRRGRALCSRASLEVGRSRAIRKMGQALYAMHKSAYARAPLRMQSSVRAFVNGRRNERCFAERRLSFRSRIKNRSSTDRFFFFFFPASLEQYFFSPQCNRVDHQSARRRRAANANAREIYYTLCAEGAANTRRRR